MCVVLLVVSPIANALRGKGLDLPLLLFQVNLL